MDENLFIYHFNVTNTINKIPKEEKVMYFNREVSWLKFNERILEVGERETDVAEKIRFLNIVDSNLREFYAVRVGGLLDSKRLGYETDICGYTAEEQLEMIKKEVETFYERRNVLENEIEALLSAKGIEVYTRFYGAEDALISLRKIYYKKISKLRFMKKPFKKNLNEGINLAVIVNGKNGKELKVMCIPDKYDRLIQIPDTQSYITMEYLLELFIREEMDVCHVIPFRITRSAQLNPDELVDDDLLEFSKVIKKRKRGKITCVEVDLMAVKKSEREDALDLFRQLSGVRNERILVHPVIDSSFFKELKLKSSVPKMEGKKFCKPKQLMGMIDVGGEGDMLLHYPYHSFDSVIQMLKDASTDNDVETICISLYRTANNSKVVKYLCEAAKNGKDVNVLVEFKARFDETHNIKVAKKLFKAGCNVIHPPKGIKVHSKLLGIQMSYGKTYSYIGTGNFNEKTATGYVDYAYLTTDREVYQDIQNVICSKSIDGKKLILSPDNMRTFYDEEFYFARESVKEGKFCEIIIKANSISDEKLIDAIYDTAINGGVKFKLIVRGICCIAPCENIKVYSVVGKYLEHARAMDISVYTEDNETSLNAKLIKRKCFIGSADLMPRNLNRRIEAIIPIERGEIKSIIHNQLELEMAGKNYTLNKDGSYTFNDHRIDSQLDNELQFMTEKEKTNESKKSKKTSK